MFFVIKQNLKSVRVQFSVKEFICTEKMSDFKKNKKTSEFTWSDESTQLLLESVNVNVNH